MWICAKARGSSGVSWIVPGRAPRFDPSGTQIVFQRAKRCPRTTTNAGVETVRRCSTSWESLWTTGLLRQREVALMKRTS